MNTTLLDASPKDSLESYLRECERVGADVDVIRSVALETIAHLKGTRSEQTELGRELERRWYDSLESGSPDWSVYATDYYLADLWACWAIYSRTYLRTLLLKRIGGSNSSEGESFMEHARGLGIETVLDLGCGCGLTTAALKDLFPEARVVGTNLEGTRQIEIARRMAVRHDFEVQTEPTEHADLVFASEYFEHFTSPVNHLQQVVAASSPGVMLIANSFGTRSIGHFPFHFIGGEWIPSDRAQREFAKALRSLGYEKVKTRFWNNKPAYWRLRSRS